MLVLTRKINESISIAGGIEVLVVDVRGKRVRLGFQAPRSVSIQRKERAAVQTVPDDSEPIPQSRRVALPISETSALRRPR